ncbi:ubiquitin-like autophagy protein Apg12-domain-containing protein [Geopyxis carbonaria]|nr:ubiquitin-like autophagy protein Apg12-domain-containing protein [Geopyxis carbonaria]
MSASPPASTSTSPPSPPSPSPSPLPIPLSTSLLLTSLPRDGQLALSRAQAQPATKVGVRFKAMMAAPALAKDVYKIKSSQRFESVVAFLRKALGLGDADGIYAYVNWSFAPALDENVGNLWNCFKTDDVLLVTYSLQSAFG